MGKDSVRLIDRHSNCKIATGRVVGADGTLDTTGAMAGTPSVGVITTARSAAGTYSLTLSNFRGELGRVQGVNLEAMTADRTVYINGEPTYSGDTLTVNVKSRTSDPTAAAAADADSDFFFTIISE